MRVGASVALRASRSPFVVIMTPDRGGGGGVDGVVLAADEPVVLSIDLLRAPPRRDPFLCDDKKDGEEGVFLEARGRAVRGTT